MNLLEYLWPMRWNSRSAPFRSTRTGTPGYFASNVLAMRSAAERSIEVYQTTLPSFLAASISAGEIVLAGGKSSHVTWARTGTASIVADASVAAPLSVSRRVKVLRMAFPP